MRRVVPLLVTVGFLAHSIPSFATATTLVDTEFLTVKAKVSRVENCPIPLGHLRELCPVSWDNNGTLQPGDDRIDVVKRVEEVKVKVRPPVDLPQTTIGVNPDELRVYHPAYTVLNHTWLELQDSRPAPVRPYVSFESRPSRTFYNGTWHDSDNDWGLYAVVYFPFPVTATGKPLEWYSVPVLCWKARDTCQLRDDDHFQVEEESVQPFPHGARLADPDDSDEDMRSVVREATYCYLLLPNEVCALQAGARPTLVSIVRTSQEATPTFGWGVQYNRTVVQVKHGRPVEVLDLLNSLWSEHLVTDPKDGPLGRASIAETDSAVPSTSSFEEATSRTAAVTGSTASTPGALPSIQPDLPSSYLWITAAGALALVILLLYHRITRLRAFESPMRQRAYDLIVKEPGIRVGTLASRLETDISTMSYHVRLLAKLGLVTTAGSGRKLYFATGAAALADERVRTMPSSPANAAVYRLVKMRDGADVSAIANALGLHVSTVSKCAMSLERLGFVERQRHGKRVLIKLVRRPTELAQGSPVQTCQN